MLNDYEVYAVLNDEEDEYVGDFLSEDLPTELIVVNAVGDKVVYIKQN